MRAIDADEVTRGIKQQFCTVCDNCTGIRCRSCDVAECMRMIDDTSTIGSESVKYGTWVEKKPSRMKWIPDESNGIMEEETPVEDMIEQKCSVCQRWAIKFANHIEMNYCSNCGARMITKGNG